MAEAKTPQFSMPKFDMDAIVAFQKANVETVVAAQKIYTDAMTALIEMHKGYLSELSKQAQGFMSFDPKTKPETMIEEVKAVTDRAMAVAKEGFDLSVKANTEVADLVSKRATANLDEMKNFSAA